jgi:hypothetical protein
MEPLVSVFMPRNLKNEAITEKAPTKLIFLQKPTVTHIGQQVSNYNAISQLINSPLLALII